MGLEDDVVYLKILLFTFVSSYFIKRIPIGYRDAVSSVLGITTVCVVCGFQIFYSLPLVLINIGIIKIRPRNPILNFIFGFAYLTFFRCAHLICGGGLVPKYLPHANAVQLIMTLRCVGLAFELSDQRKAKRQLASQDHSDANEGGRTLENELSDDWMDMVYYCYNLVGLFTGPYYSYRVHRDMACCRYLRQIPYSAEVVNRLMTVPLLISFFLVVQAVCPVEDAHKASFYETNSFWTLLLYPVPVFAYTRTRCYIAWIISEASCMVAGIGAYPKASKPKPGLGPSDMDAYKNIVKTISNGDVQSNVEYDYETIRNIDIYGCEFSHTFREGMRSWNRSVQYWLATYVYRRCPWRSLRTSITMLVSAYWHGVHAGYYLSFMTVPLCLYAEDLAFSVMEKKADRNEENVSKFRLCWWFFRMRGFEYMVMGFLLLSWTSTTTFWASTYYWYHSALIVVIVAMLIRKYSMPKTKDE